MKISKALLLLIVFGQISCKSDPKFTVSCLPTNLQSGVLAFYPFSQGSLRDESANANDITNTTTATPSTDRNGNANCAFQFTNTQSKVELLTTANTGFLNGLNEFSISVWYLPLDTARIGGSYEILLSRGIESRCPDRRGEWSLGLYDCRRAVFGHNNSVWANKIAGPSNDCQSEIITLTDKWHHVVATKKNGDYKIYFNGKLDESAFGNANCTNLHQAQDIGELFIGRYYTGKIDDILIYNRELSQAEVTVLFALEPCCQ
jgi:Concanavalin A-like lectin/glucanases superfamily